MCYTPLGITQLWLLEIQLFIIINQQTSGKLKLVTVQGQALYNKENSRISNTAFTYFNTYISVSGNADIDSRAGPCLNQITNQINTSSYRKSNIQTKLKHQFSRIKLIILQEQLQTPCLT